MLSVLIRIIIGGMFVAVLKRSDYFVWLFNKVTESLFSMFFS